MATKLFESALKVVTDAVMTELQKAAGTGAFHLNINCYMDSRVIRQLTCSHNLSIKTLPRPPVSYVDASESNNNPPIWQATHGDRTWVEYISY